MTRARRWSLSLRDAAALAAFGSMFISGELPVWVTGIYALSAASALLRMRPLARVGKASLLLLVFAAVGLYGGVAQGTVDLVIAASSFAALLTAHRQLSEPTSSTDDQVLLLCLLMICGGAALSADLLFAVFLTVFALCASVSRGLSLVDEVSADEPAPLRPATAQILRGAFFAMVGAAVFFVLFPRLSWNVAARSAASGLGKATTGFSDGVRLGTSGDVKSNPRPVMRVKLAPDPKHSSLELYWMGRALETFDGASWSTDKTFERQGARLHLEEPGFKDVFRQEIEVLPALGSRTIPMLERVIAAGPVWHHSRAGKEQLALQLNQDVELRADRELTSFKVLVHSAFDPSGPSAQLPSGDLSRYLQLPANLDPRIAELARTITRGERRPLEAARLIEAYLTKTYGYSLELEGVGADPLAAFLFVTKKGHCEYFATALTVMLRTLGIHSRVATGFFGGTRLGEIYVLRAADAHAWSQVLVPEMGFFTVDATPLENRSGTPSLLLELATRLYEQADTWWRSGVVDFSIFDQLRLVKSVSWERSSGSTSASESSPSRRVWVSLGTGLAVLLLTWIFWGRRSRARPHEATRLLEAVEKALVDARVADFPGVPAEEAVSKLPPSSPLYQPAQRAMRRYLEARYGGVALNTEDRQTLASSVLKAAKQSGEAGQRMDRA